MVRRWILEDGEDYEACLNVDWGGWGGLRGYRYRLVGSFLIRLIGIQSNDVLSKLGRILDI